MTLNQKQRGIVFASALIFVAMGLYPPWISTFHSELHHERPAGYALIIAPPKPGEGTAMGIRLDLSRLLVEWLVLAAATGGVILLVKGTRAE